MPFGLGVPGSYFTRRMNFKLLCGMNKRFQAENGRGTKRGAVAGESKFCETLNDGKSALKSLWRAQGRRNVMEEKTLWA